MQKGLKHIEHLIDRGVSETEARAQVDRWIDHHELTGAFELPFDKSKFSGATIDDIFVNPDRFVNQTMADPLEGSSYGRGKAIRFQRADGSLFVNSFAHGGITYELKAPPKRFTLERFATINLETAASYLVDGLIPRAGLTIIWGPPKCGKSFWAFDLTMHIALIQAYRGHRVHGGPVVYLALEGSAGSANELPRFANGTVLLIRRSISLVSQLI